jgi:hypothetical protein
MSELRHFVFTVNVNNSRKKIDSGNGVLYDNKMNNFT